MENSSDLGRLAEDARYRRLVARRGRFAWLLTAMLLIAYFGYILLVAFAKPWLAQPIGDGVTSIGIPIGLAVILFAVALTGIYVRRANREFDRRLDEIVRDWRR